MKSGVECIGVKKRKKKKRGIEGRGDPVNF